MLLLIQELKLNHKTLVASGREIVQNAPQAFIDLDVEADGIPGIGSLLSIGAVSPWGDEFYAELRPASNDFIPSNRKFCEEHNLGRRRLLQEGSPHNLVIQDLAAWTNEVTEVNGKEGAVLTAFNASFDFPWIDLGMKQARVDNPFGVAGFCIKSMAMALPGMHDWRKTAKGNLPSNLVPPGDFTHNAFEDAVYQQKIHFALVGALALGR